MKRDYLGDSYDAVKRLWRQLLADWAPLYAEPRFLLKDLHEDFTRLTGIPVLSDQRPHKYSILNDPDTGIRLPGEENQAEGRTHITVAAIVEQLRTQGPRCVVTFDQSDYRNSDLKRDEQRRAKLQALREGGCPAFYYGSHAPFLFAFPTIEALQQLEGRLIQAGIPADRLEKEQ
ncbi:MAG: hypothetical protein WD894_02155 [Pirellulales bacterium]